VAAAFPPAPVARWATDDHRLGRKPVRKRVGTLPGQRPLAAVDPRSAWRCLVAFVPPAAGRTLWPLAPGVSAARFTAE